MSVEPTQLERTALERKDRDELHTIAEAMGGSPGARASKTKIIDLILELAGVTEAPAPTGDGAREEAGADDDGGARNEGGAEVVSAREDTADDTDDTDDADDADDTTAEATDD